MPESASGPAAAAFAARAADGRFELQSCRDCGAIFWPPRDICGSCWSTSLDWQAVSPLGVLIAETTLHASASDYFRDRLPWRIGVVKLETGPVVFTHLADNAREGERVRVIARMDKLRRGVLIALSENEDEIETDLKLLELTGARPMRCKNQRSQGRNE